MRKRLLFILIPMIIIGAIFFGGYYIYDHTINIDKIYSGVMIEDLDLGLLTKEEALIRLKEIKGSEIINKKMRLSDGNTEYEVSLMELGFSYEYNKAIDDAYEFGRDGNIISRYREIKEIGKSGRIVELESKYDRSKIETIARHISKDLSIESKDAIFNFNGGNITITEEIIGKKVDTSKLVEFIEKNIYVLEDIIIPIDIEEPKYTKAYFGKINGIIGDYSTSYQGSGVGRTQNIKLSAGSINGILLHPGEVLSYNETTGPRQKKFGYEEAPVIVNGELTPGIGGGVCQTSTTLYNAALYADLTILERAPHSIPPSYIAKGRDAAVATGYLDLRFKNDHDFPIYISSYTEGNKVFFNIYGDKNSKDYQIKIDTVLTETIPYKVQENLDESLESSARKLVQEGRSGYKVKTFRSIIKDGKEIEKIQISSDYYREKDYIYLVGPILSPVVEEPNLDER